MLRFAESGLRPWRPRHARSGYPLLPLAFPPGASIHRPWSMRKAQSEQSTAAGKEDEAANGPSRPTSRLSRVPSMRPLRLQSWFKQFQKHFSSRDLWAQRRLARRGCASRQTIRPGAPDQLLELIEDVGIPPTSRYLLGHGLEGLRGGESALVGSLRCQGIIDIHNLEHSGRYGDRLAKKSIRIA